MFVGENVDLFLTLKATSQPVMLYWLGLEIVVEIEGSSVLQKRKRFFALYAFLLMFPLLTIQSLKTSGK